MFSVIYGVDFSGARLAGKNTWVARLEPSQEPTSTPYRLTSLSSLESLAGTAVRAGALNHLVEMIRASDDALWAMDFPFGLPIEVMDAGASWLTQFHFLRRFGEDAYASGLECLRRAQQRGGPNHIRRQTDAEAKAPFDCYHYRIIYQTFHGIRDVLGPLRRSMETAILPFHYRRLATARRVLVETCTASTLKRLGLPHQKYKQPAGGFLTSERWRNRWTIVDGLSRDVSIRRRDRRMMMNNPGGDALDAVVAAVGALQAWKDTDHRLIARHPRYRREGRLYF
jgi:hypothetical protein